MPEAHQTSHTGALVATAVLLGLWVVATFAATPLLPLVQGVVETVEVRLGFDVAIGADE